MIDKMRVFRVLSSFFVILLYFQCISAQTTYYTDYRSSFPYVTSCPSNQYFDTALMRCSTCPDNSIQKSGDFTRCDCFNSTFYYGVNQGGGSLLCLPCDPGQKRSKDGFGCITNSPSCDSTTVNNILYQSSITGSLSGTNAATSSAQPRIGDETCSLCANGTIPDPESQRCIPCASVTPRTGAATGNTSVTCCTASTSKNGMCLTTLKIETETVLETILNLNRFSTPFASKFIQEHLEASVFLCRMNLNLETAQSLTRKLLSNVTACHVLGNIAAMQFYYGLDGYAYDLYDTYIWQSQRSPSVWSSSSVRTAIPFLAYPTTYYEEITSSSYNWIPASFTRDNILNYKLAKYSPTGQYLGVVDAIDAHIQLCGGAYTDGKAAFTFGAQYKKLCTVRADALWRSPLYETAFFEPYVVFTQSSAERMIPSSVVIYNYQSTSGSGPNKVVDGQSQWVHHRRFFLLDRISGVNTNNELKSIHYAKSIKIVTTLTADTSYILPPILQIEYAELSSSDIDTGKLVEISFESEYQMNLDLHVRDIWIAVGVLSALGLLWAFFRTTSWQYRSGIDVIELRTIGKALLYAFHALAAIFFIVMAGVSMWWLIFFKRQDAIYLVLPTTFQQASFTSLVVLAFALKTIDIIHLIFRQSMDDIFFIDWEKPRTEKSNSVGVWRSYFVANEFNEIQAFRRINLTFQLFFVLFLLKVINLENIATAQPNIILFPTTADHQPEYNGILRVGIGFSMWAVTGLILYLVYILFQRRFVEDRILNFIDLCSVSNVSVFVLVHRLYGFYIHGRSPHGATDVNMKEMILNLERESKRMSGGRGLLPQSDDQTFIMRLEPEFRLQYETLLYNYRSRVLQRGANRDENEAEILMNSYRNLNDFLCAFINHSLPNYDYKILERRFIEKLLDYDFQIVPRGMRGVGQPFMFESIFTVDTERSFMNCFFAGYENSLFMWNAATFLFIDYFATNYVLAAIVTYLLNLFAVKLRLSIGRKNLASKTLIPKEFLI